MKSIGEKKDKNYLAVERALSIVLQETGDEKRQIAQTIYTVYIRPYFWEMAMPVLQKHINENSIYGCIKSAQRKALARMMRGWLFWAMMAFGICLPCLAVHISLYIVMLLVLLSIISISFIARKILWKMWENRGSGKMDDRETLEKIINLCKKNSLQICIDYLMKK